MKTTCSIYFRDETGHYLSPVLDNPFVPSTGDIVFLGSEDRPNELPRRYRVALREFAAEPRCGVDGWSVQVAVIVYECPNVCPSCHEKSATHIPIVHRYECKVKRTP